MGTVKRVYLYSVSAISLLVLSIGLYDLVAFVFGELTDALGANILAARPSRMTAAQPGHRAGGPRRPMRHRLEIPPKVGRDDEAADP